MAPNDEPFILIVEDDSDQAALIQAAFKTSLAQSQTHLVYNGLEALLYLAGEGVYKNRDRFPLPSLIVLDLRLPDSNGFEALVLMAEWEWLAKIPVVVFTSEDPEHERRAYALGVRRYMHRPDDYGELVVAVREELGLPAVVRDYMEEDGSEPGPIEVQGVIPWIADAETWIFTYVGPEAENLLGYPIRDWYKRDFWAKHIHDDDRDWAINYCERMSRTKEAYVFDYRMTKKGGGFIWLRDFVRVDSLDGVPVTLRGFMFDISELDEDEAGGGHPPHKTEPDEGGSDKELHWWGSRK